MNNLAIFVDDLYGRLSAERSQWTAIWKDIATYVVPLRENIEGTLRAGFESGKEIYDTTGLISAKLFTDGLHSNLVSPSSQWFGLLMEREDLNDLEGVSQWLQDITLRFFRIFGNSSFYSEFWNYLYDGVTIGTAVMYMEYDFDNNFYMFETVHPGECYIDEDVYKRVDTVVRKRRLTASQIKSIFDNIPEIVERSTPSTQFDVIHAVFPRSDYSDNSVKIAKNKKYASVWKLIGDGGILRESGYDYFPFAVWRYLKSGNEIYGRSPAYYALWDIKANNVIAKSNMMTAQLRAKPPLNVPVELKNKINIVPNGINYYTDANRLVFPINVSGDLMSGLAIEDRKMKAIERHFNLDFFYMMANAERQMTATEIIERQGEKSAVLAASVGRLNNETLDRIIDFVFNKEMELKRLPPLPPVLEQFAGEPIKVEYTGQLAKAQRRLLITQSINASMQTLLPLIQLFPEVRNVINPEETAREVLKAYGYPEKAIRSREEVFKLSQENAIINATNQISNNPILSTIAQRGIENAINQEGEKSV